MRQALQGLARVGAVEDVKQGAAPADAHTGSTVPWRAAHGNGQRFTSAVGYLAAESMGGGGGAAWVA